MDHNAGRGKVSMVKKDSQSNMQRDDNQRRDQSNSRSTQTFIEIERRNSKQDITSTEQDEDLWISFYFAI